MTVMKVLFDGGLSQVLEYCTTSANNDSEVAAVHYITILFTMIAAIDCYRAHPTNVITSTVDRAIISHVDSR